MTIPPSKNANSKETSPPLKEQCSLEAKSKEAPSLEPIQVNLAQNTQVTIETGRNSAEPMPFYQTLLNLQQPKPRVAIYQAVAKPCQQELEEEIRQAYARVIPVAKLPRKRAQPIPPPLPPGLAIAQPISFSKNPIEGKNFQNHTWRILQAIFQRDTGSKYNLHDLPFDKTTGKWGKSQQILNGDGLAKDLYNKVIASNNKHIHINNLLSELQEQRVISESFMREYWNLNKMDETGNLGIYQAKNHDTCELPKYVPATGEGDTAFPYKNAVLNYLYSQKLASLDFVKRNIDHTKHGTPAQDLDLTYFAYHDNTTYPYDVLQMQARLRAHNDPSLKFDKITLRHLVTGRRILQAKAALKNNRTTEIPEIKTPQVLSLPKEVTNSILKTQAPNYAPLDSKHKQRHAQFLNQRQVRLFDEDEPSKIFEDKGIEQAKPKQREDLAKPYSK